jgi:arginine/ornithine N-succinyltransferase beta subunit
VVRNDRAADLYVTYCATQACPVPATRLIASGKTWRVSNVSYPNSGGYLFVTVAGRQVGCTQVAPAVTMVDRLFSYPISSIITNSCAGYDPRRLHLTLKTSRV